MQVKEFGPQGARVPCTPLRSTNVVVDYICPSTNRTSELSHDNMVLSPAPPPTPLHTCNTVCNVALMSSRDPLTISYRIWHMLDLLENLL